MDPVVVSGLSLRLPGSDNAEAFWQNLLRQVDLVSDTPRSWDPEDYELPRSYGQLGSVDRFDSRFFDVHPKQAEKLDPQVRMLLEVAHEAVLDAAVNPAQLAGSRTGVFVGACGSDVMANNVNGLDEMTGYEATGCAISMFANRISYHFDLRGPSLSVDTACASSLTAFDLACRAIATGQCDHALVGGSNFIFHPLWSIGFGRLNMLSPDGRCMSFHEDANGFARSEGVVVLFLTRESTATKRYARVLATGSNNDGFTQEGITFPRLGSQEDLLRRVWSEAGADVEQLAYVEAHGTGTPAGDPVELGALDRVLFDELGRSAPVPVGSVKSVMGHAEGASGLAGMAKVLLSMLHGKVPPGRFVDRPKQAIPALAEGRMQVVADELTFTEGLAAVSSFGFGGSNTHVILERTPPSAQRDGSLFPLPYSARTPAGQDRLEAVLEQTAELAPSSILLSSLHRAPLARNPHRGFLLRDGDGGVLARVRSEADGARSEGRPVWLVFNGVGSQWPGMGAALRDVPTARAVLDRCHDHLTRHGVDLWGLLTSEDPDTFSGPTNIFLGVASIQLAQLACLRALGVEAQGCFGHSAGELVCAYFDGTLELEQVLDIAYFRGRSLEDSPIGHGAMAAVESDLEGLLAELPEDLEVACHNSRYSFTIAGPQSSIEAFAAQMERTGRPTRVVDTGGVPFHSSYIRCAEATFREHLARLLPAPRERTGRWLSTSRELGWTGPDLADEQYFVDNLFEPVQFARCLEQLPDDALVIELGPHALLRSQCRTARPGCAHVRLMKRGEPTSALLWHGLGQLHCEGVALDWVGLLPHLRADNPLARVPELVAWDHERVWALPEVRTGRAGVDTDVIEDFVVDLGDPDNAFVKDHIVNGKPIFPGVGYLHLVWLTLAKWKRLPPEQLAMELRDIRFVRASIFRDTAAIRLTIKVDTLTQDFVVLEGDQLVARGKVASVGQADLRDDELDTAWAVPGQQLERSDVYKLFVRTGIEYGNLFRGIAAVSRDRTRALVDWTLNWPTYFDAVLQLLFVGSPSEAIGVPRSIDSFRFDPTRVPDDRLRIPAAIDSVTGSVRTPCVEIEGVSIHSNYEPDVGPHELHALSFQPFADARPFPVEVQAYLELCRTLVCHHLHRVLHLEDLTGLESAHLDRIRETLGAEIGPQQIDWQQVEALRSHPQAHMLRLVEHVFDHWRELVRDAMPVILGSEAHELAYREDFTSAHRVGIVDDMLELVVRNTEPGVLRAVELGAGTGALSSLSVPYLGRYSLDYEVTDLSAGYFPDLEEELEAYADKTRFRVWDANTPMGRTGQVDLVLGSNALHTVRDVEQSLGHVAESLKEGGFLMLEEMTGNFWYSVGIWGFIREFWDIEDERTCGMYLDREGWVRAAERVGLTLVMERHVGDALSYLLFRKQPAVAERARIVEVGDLSQPAAFEALQATLRAQAPDETLWLRADRDTVPGLDAFVRCLAQEGRGPIRGLQLDGPGEPSATELVEVLRGGLISNVYKDGRWGSYFRTAWDDAADAGEGGALVHQLRAVAPGDLTSVRRVPDWSTVPDQAAVTVRCFPLNFKDVMLASGKIASSEYKPFGEALGLEYAGVLDDGTRVMGLNLSGGGLGERIALDDPHCWWRVPEGMSLEAACTMPVAYATAYASVVLRGRAEAGERIFIHSGAGSVGQAAIRIALNLGLEVFTTVSSEAKVDFLMARYPELRRERILDSRSTRFKAAILEQTDGRGVDVVVNSFSGEKLVKSLECLARYGRFVDISRYDAFHNSNLPMRAFLKDLTFTNIALDEMYRDGHRDVARIHAWLDEALASGELLPIHHAEADSVVDAMQQLLRGDTIGKLVVQMEGCQTSIPTLDVFACRPDRSYLVTGGLGGLGLELCQWLASRGARELLIASRSSELTAYQQLKVDQLRAQGVSVEVTDADLSRTEVAEACLEALETRRPVGGIFHLAMTLRDQPFVDSSFSDFQLPVRVKAGIGRSLDAASRTRCPHLEHFVVFSSVVSHYGNEGQAAYGLGNGILERLVEERRLQGLPGLAIQWGAVADTGFVARSEMEHSFGHLGMQSMSLLSVLASLDALLLGGAPVVSSHAPLRPEKRADADDGRPPDLVDSVLGIMGFERGAPGLEEDRTLTELGVDSLMVVEISQICARHHGLSLSPRQIRELTLARLRELGGAAPEVADVAEPVSIHDPMPEVGTARVCYYLDGMFLDPRASLDAMDRSADTTFFVVPYHDGVTELDALAATFRRHFDALPATVEQVTLAGFSFGSVVAVVLGEQVRSSGRPVVTKGFAVPRVVYDEPLYRKLLPLAAMLEGRPVESVGDALDLLIERSDHEGARSAVLSQARAAFGMPSDGAGMVPYEGMLSALRFLYRNRERLVPGACDEVTVFRGDHLSVDAETAQALAPKVSVIDARHRSSEVRL